MWSKKNNTKNIGEWQLMLYKVEFVDSYFPTNGWRVNV